MKGGKECEKYMLEMHGEIYIISFKYFVIDIMDLDIQLHFAEKYNWWSTKKWKQNLSTEKKLSYIMMYGSLRELIFVFEQFDMSTLVRAFESIERDEFSLGKKRQEVIRYLLRHKSDNAFVC